MDEPDRARQTSLEALDAVFERVPWHASEQGFRVRLWDNTTWPEEAVPSPASILVLNHPAASVTSFLMVS